MDIQGTKEGFKGETTMETIREKMSKLAGIETRLLIQIYCDFCEQDRWFDADTHKCEVCHHVKEPKTRCWEG